MTREEVAFLLGIIATFDRRTVGEAEVISWHQLLERHQIGDAVEAVRRHFKHSDKFLMPVHLIEGMKAVRADRHEQTRHAEISGRPAPAFAFPTPDYIAARDQLSAAAGGNPQAPAPVKAIGCPWCKAQPGVRCTTPQGAPLRLTAAHPARYAAAGLDEPPRVDQRALAALRSDAPTPTEETP